MTEPEGHNVTSAAVDKQDSPSGDRPPSGAGQAKVRSFADKVRLGTEIDRARAIQEEVRTLQDEAARHVTQLGAVVGRLGTLIANLERERDGGPR